jgi:small nuclear ribonucleoprotein (snRNP)-like protein
MMHYPFEEWMKYVENKLDLDVREVYEDHLYSCDQCLNLYLQAVSEAGSQLPVMTNEDSFTDFVMAQASEIKLAEQKSVKGKERKLIFKSTFFHYTLAAAMTILLMMTGVFQSITQYAGNVQSPDFQQKETSVTAGFVDKTFAWMDSLEKTYHEEGK